MSTILNNDKCSLNKNIPANVVKTIPKLDLIGDTIDRSNFFSVSAVKYKDKARNNIVPNEYQNLVNPSHSFKNTELITAVTTDKNKYIQYK